MTWREREARPQTLVNCAGAENNPAVLIHRGHQLLVLLLQPGDDKLGLKQQEKVPGFQNSLDTVHNTRLQSAANSTVVLMVEAKL